MKIFPLKPMSNYDRLKNLVKIMEYNQKLKMGQKADLNAFSSDKFVKNAK